MRVQRAIKRGAGVAMLNEMYARVHTHARSDTGTARCARAVSARPRNIRIGRARVRARAHVGERERRALRVIAIAVIHAVFCLVA